MVSTQHVVSHYLAAVIIIILVAMNSLPLLNPFSTRLHLVLITHWFFHTTYLLIHISYLN